MFGEKVKIEIEVSKNLLENSRNDFLDKNIDLSKAVNLFLQASLNNEGLYLPKDLLEDYTRDKEKLARIYLEKLLADGQESFKDLSISQEEILMFLGVM